MYIYYMYTEYIQYSSTCTCTLVLYLPLILSVIPATTVTLLLVSPSYPDNCTVSSSSLLISLTSANDSCTPVDGQKWKGCSLNMYGNILHSKLHMVQMV